MSKTRKCAGTETATKSAPPPKKTRPRKSDTAPKDTTAKDSTSKTKTSKDKTTTKAAPKAAPKAAAQKGPAAGKKGTAKDTVNTAAKGAATAKGTAATGKKTKARAAREADALDEEGFAIVAEEGEDGDEGSDNEKSEEEEEIDSEEEIEWMEDKCNSTIYAFYEPHPTVEYVDGRRAHTFKCAAKRCKQRVRRYLDTKDRSSTSNMRRHAVRCWGKEAVEAAREAASVKEARENIVEAILQSGSITAHFERKKGKVTFSHRQHTRAEARLEIVKWVMESLRPFRIVEDPRFEMLMKTRRPGYYIPSASTVARDVNEVFLKTKERIARMLQEYEGALHFATDAWISPNHRAFVVVTVHFELQGKPISLLLDIVEVAESHTGANLALVFAGILRDFGIQTKILGVTCDNASNNDTMIDALADMDSPAYLEEFEGLCAHIRCFLHILNIVCGKNLICHFDPRVVKDKDKEDAEEREIDELVAALEDEDEAPEQAEDGGEDSGVEEEHSDEPAQSTEDKDLDDVELDATAAMTDEEHAQFHWDIGPIKLLLAKIRNFSSKVVNSSTRLLPVWKELVATHGLPA